MSDFNGKHLSSNLGGNNLFTFIIIESKLNFSEVVKHKMQKVNEQC